MQQSPSSSSSSKASAGEEALIYDELAEFDTAAPDDMYKGLNYYISTTLRNSHPTTVTEEAAAVAAEKDEFGSVAVTGTMTQSNPSRCHSSSSNNNSNSNSSSSGAASSQIRDYGESAVDGMLDGRREPASTSGQQSDVQPVPPVSTAPAASSSSSALPASPAGGITEVCSDVRRQSGGSQARIKPLLPEEFDAELLEVIRTYYQRKQHTASTSSPYPSISPLPISVTAKVASAAGPERSTPPATPPPANVLPSMTAPRAPPLTPRDACATSAAAAVRPPAGPGGDTLYNILSSPPPQLWYSPGQRVPSYISNAASHHHHHHLHHHHNPPPLPHMGPSVMPDADAIGDDGAARRAPGDVRASASAATSPATGFHDISSEAAGGDAPSSFRAGGGGGSALVGGLFSLPSYSSTSFVRAYVSDISLSLEPAIIVSGLAAALNMVVVYFLQHHVLDTRDHLGLFLIGSYLVFSSYYMIYYFLERFSTSFRRIASQDKKFYIIGNLLKAGILISITPFAFYHLVKIIVLDEWESNILRNLGCIYAIPDFISMIIVKRMRWSTWLHHLCVVVFNYFSILNDYQNENVCRCVVVYAAFSSFAYCVNVLLASRFLGVSVSAARVLSFVALTVYVVCCATNWMWQVYYLRRLITTGNDHWTVYVYMFLILLVMWDDVILNRWLLHHAKNTAFAASQQLQQRRQQHQTQHRRR